jgi:hypothetical protein
MTTAQRRAAAARPGSSRTSCSTPGSSPAEQREQTEPVIVLPNQAATLQQEERQASEKANCAYCAHLNAHSSPSPIRKRERAGHVRQRRGEEFACCRHWWAAGPATWHEVMQVRVGVVTDARIVPPGVVEDDALMAM